MPRRPVSPTRAVAREAVRRDLARTALALFEDLGFDVVTLEHVAAAAGVSKSTLLRYFDSKDELVLGAFRIEGASLVAAVHEAPSTVDAWSALRRAAEVVADRVCRDPKNALTVARLVQQTPALRARQYEERALWALQLGAELQRRDPAAGDSAQTWAAAAMACLGVALERWTSSLGETGLEGAINDTFAAIQPRAAD